MLQFLYSWYCYRNIKSGLLLDFYTKRIWFFLMRGLFYTLSLFFSDKFLIEHFSFIFYKGYAIFSFVVTKLLSLSYLIVLSLIAIQIMLFISVYALYLL